MPNIAVTLTDNYQFREPIIGADDTTWGNDFTSGDPLVDPSPGLNGNIEKADRLLKAQADKIAELQAVIDGLPGYIDGLRIQIGGIHATTDATNPATALGYGTWEAWGLGRALVSAGGDWVVEEEKGSEVHLLTEAEIPVHDHGSSTRSGTTNSTGSHSHSYTGRGTSVGADQESGGRTSASTKNTGTTGNHTHSFSWPEAETTSFGGGEAHNNVMPSKAAYLWKRTA